MRGTRKQNVWRGIGVCVAITILIQLSREVQSDGQAKDAEKHALLAEAERYRKLGEDRRKKETERAAAEAAKERAQQEWWENRKDWIENFPFEPSYHPTLTFQASKQGTNESGYWKWDVNDPVEEEMMSALHRHTFVKDFYENPARFDRAFEKLYEILSEYGYADNPERLGNIYSSAKGYHERLPMALEDPHGRAPGIAHNERGYLTRREDLDIFQRGIVGHLTSKKRNLLPGEEPIPLIHAEEIQERILTEIPPADFTGSFAYNADYLKEVQPGDPLLMK